MSKHHESDLMICLLGIGSRIQKRVGGTLATHGIGLSEYLVLHRLYTSPSQTLRRSDLAEQVGLSPSGITRLINPMEKIGLLDKEENPRDARVSLVTLSPAGRQVYEDARVTVAHASAYVFSSLSRKQLGTLTDLLELIAWQGLISAP